MYHLRRIKSLMLTLLVCTAAHAQIESGKVYNFVNIGNAGKSMTYISENKLSIATTDNTDYKQLWYVEGNADSGYTLRSMANGYYLRSQNSANNTSWTTVKDIDNNCRFSCIAAGNGYTLRATNTTNDQHSMHYGSGTNSIVCWYSTANASQWTLTEVSLTEEELTANWEYVTSLRSGDIYQTALDALFTDNSCSELKPSYASYTKSQMMNDANYKALSSTLQKMVLKMCTDGTWQENNYDNSKESWSADYAKKYRVQLYEPYNNISAASTALSLNEHTNMNNPTGIFSGGREVIYVMVEDTIKDGSSLYLDSYTGHNKLGTDHKKGIQLHEGLNVIPSEVAGNNYFINYVVETFDISDGKRGHEAKARSLKNYEPLKIHIEGGYINGYYNKVGDALYGSGDKNADWEYIEARATQTDVTVLGKYMTLQFPLRDEDTEQYEDEKDGNKVKWHKGLGSYLNELVKIEYVINSWDNVMMWERLLLGVLDENTVNAEAKQSPYSITGSKQVIEYTGDDQEFPTGYGDYYNIHGLAYGVGGSAYMYGSGDHSGYHYNTMGSIIQNMPTNAGSHWGPAHEIGHQHQNLLKIRKEMEVTNNLFSNVVLWYFGETTSRVNGTEGSLENILNNFNKEDGHYLTNNIWGMTQMYYKLFLYYHVLGHNPKFYPRLFEILRQDPSNGMAGTVDGEEAQLHIYKKMCQAAGEDLTEFFRAHGFLKPLDGFAIDDYGVSTFYMTQAQIDAAIAEVKSWNYKENVAVLFINDATGETIKSHKGDNLELYGETRVCAEVGGYASFEESITNAEDLEFTVSGKTVTVNKGGGVGYAIFNEKGEIIAFSDKKTFTVSDECATALMWGEATVKVVNADNSVVNVENVDEVVSKYTLLGELITEADAELTYLDATNTKVGYYKDGTLTALQTARDEAKDVYDNQDTQSYTAAYAKLSEELYAVTHNDYNRVNLISGGTYRLNSRSDKSYWMSVNAENKTIGEASDDSNTKQEWVFESTGTAGVYYIKNANTSRYLTSATKNDQVGTTDNKSEAKGYKVTLMDDAAWTLQCQDDKLQFLNRNGSTVLGWNDGNDHNSQWYITFESVTEDAQKLYELNMLVQKTKELIDEMAEVTPTQKQTLQTTSSSSPFYLSTNACHNTLNNASDGQGLAGLLDEDVSTFFHSDYGNKVTDTHYLQVDLGSVKDLSEYIFYYTTRDDGNNCPTTIEVWGSTDGTNFKTLLYTFTELPTGAGQAWESPMLTQATNYSSLRFMVTAAEGGKKFFVMSRFGIAKCEATVQSMGKEYTAQGLTNDALISAYASIHKAQDKLKVGGFTSNELNSLYDELSPKYAALETIYNNAANEALDVLRGKLRSLIGEVENLYKSCGSVEVVEAVADTEVTNLQTTNPNGDYYVWTNAQSTQEGPISGLIDGLYGTGYTDKPYYFHSAYSGETITDGLKHHITINLGTNNAVSAFKFQYRNRTDAGVGFPAEIEVYGSIDGSSYNKIITLNDMEKNSTTVYTSPVIETSKEYAYLRFMVTKSSGDKSYFHMAELDLYVGTPSYYDVTLNGTHGEVDDDMMIATYDAIVAAQASVNIAATEAQLQKTINKLQAQYDVLYEAKNAAQYFTVKANIDGGGVRYDGGDPCTSILAVSASLTIEQLKEKLVAIELGGYVAQPISITDGVITVTYNKVYTVRVVGVEAANGGVTSGEATYKGGDTFEMLESEFNIKDFNVIDLQGYEENKVFEDATITITYKKVYTVQITGGKGYGNVTYNQKTYAHGDTIQVVGNIDENLIIAATLVGYNEATIEVEHDAATISATFTMPPLVDSEKYYTLACKATDHSAYIRDNGSVINGHSTEGSLFQFVKADDENGYYIKSYATDNYINHADGKVFASTEKITIWTIAKHTSEAYTLTVGDDLYLNNVDTDCTDGSCTYLQSKEHPGGPNAGNACSLWTLAVEEPVNDVTELETLISGTNSLIESCLSFTNSYYVNAEMISATTEAANSAQAICDNPSTTTLSKYTAVKESLQTAYNTLSAAKNSAETESQLRANLQTLVNNTSDLMALCGSVTYVKATEDQAVVLQTTDAAANFYLSTNAWEPKEGDIKNLIDNDDASYFHSAWSWNVEAVHHLKVDLGNGMSLKEFTFTYKTTKGLFPKVIKVYGSDESEGEGSLLGTFSSSDETNPLPTSVSQTWTSSNIPSETSYRYIRFEVTESDGGGYGATPKGEYCFVMSYFGLTSIGQPARYDIELAAPGVRGVTEELLKEVYLKKIEANNLLEGETANRDLETMIATLTTAYNNLESAYNTYVFDKSELGTLITQTRELIASCYEGETFKYTNSLHITENLVETTTSEADAAQQVFEDNVNEEQYSDALAQLKEAYANLQYAIECALFPVLLTADPASPKLYIIKTKRDGDNMVLQYDEPTELFSVAASVDKEPTQAFYFMKGDGSQVYIYPYMASGKVLAANDVTNGESKALAMEKGSATYELWVFVARADGYYNLQPTGTSTYLSNIYGTSHKMGFYNYGPDTDKGSLFKFESTTVEGSYYYLKLKDYYENQAKVAGSNIQGREAVGYYPVAEAGVYNAAYAAATEALTNEEITDDECQTAYNNLVAANEALVMNMPSADKFYRFVSADTKNDRVGGIAYADPKDNKMYWSKDKGASDATAIWTIAPADNGGYHITNLHTGTSISSFIGNKPSPLNETANAAEFVSLSGDGQVKVVCNGTMHAQSGGAVVTWNTSANDASAWRIVEVEDMSLVNFALTISQYRHAGLYLNYATEIPEGAQVYVVHTPDSEKGTITAEELKGDILPARTAVIVKGDAGTYEFKYTEGTNTIDTEKFEANDLGGSAYLKYQQVETEGNLCCVFGRKGENVGLYKNWVQYVDANGSTIKTEGEGDTDLTGTDYGTHFKISANKVYYEYEPESVAVASAFRFLFKDKEEGTTTIDELILGDDAIIYNLYGQRLTEIVLPGFYIVNGKKVYVNEKMINNK